MDVRNVKTGLFELPVVIIYRHSSLSQSNRSWSSTIQVAVQHVEQGNPHECVEKKREEFLRDMSDTCLCAGILPPPQLSKDEQYAKDLIDQNKGIVEVGAIWPACEPKPLRLHIVWHEKKALCDINSRPREQSTHDPALPLILLMGARFVEAFDVYKRERQSLMSLSILPLPEQQVAYEVNLLLSHIMKDLQSHLQLNISSTKDDVEELVLINIMNILVDMQLSDDKKATEPSLLADSGHFIVSGDYLRIVRHKVLSDLVTLVQSVLALRLPSKDSVETNRSDKGDEGKEGVRERISYMQRAVLDIIELIKHMSRAGGSCSETSSEIGLLTNPFYFRGNHGGRLKISNCRGEQIVQIQWKILLAVLEKKDPVSLENILGSICDEDKRRLVKIMAWPLGLIEKGDEELASTDFQTTAVLAGHGPGANGGASSGHNVESSDGISGRRICMAGEHLPGEGMKQGDACAFTCLAGTDPACQSACANEPGGQPIFEPFQEHVEESCVQGQGAGGWDGGQAECKAHTHLQELSKESCIEGQGAVGQSEYLQHACAMNQAHKTGQGLDVHKDLLPTDVNYHVRDQSDAPARNRLAVLHKDNTFVINSPSHTHQLQAVLHNNQDVDPSHEKGDSVGGSPSHTHQLQAAMPENPDINPSPGSGGLHIVKPAALETAVDSIVPDYASSYATSSSQPIASSDNDDFHVEVEVSRARHRKRRNRKAHWVNEEQIVPFFPHFWHHKSQLPLRKIWLVVTMAFILGATAIGIFWFQTDFSSNPRTRQHRAFARGYLP